MMIIIIIKWVSIANLSKTKNKHLIILYFHVGTRPLIVVLGDDEPSTLYKVNCASLFIVHSTLL